jgi:hypothetical protein
MIRSEKVLATKDASTVIRIHDIAHDRSSVVANAITESEGSSFSKFVNSNLISGHGSVASRLV